MLSLIVVTAQAQRTFIKHFGTSSSEYGTSLVQATDGGFIVAQSVNQGTQLHAGLVKTDANGHMEWSRVYKLRDITVVKSMQRWGNGYIILANTWDAGVSAIRTVLFRINTDGDMLWMKEYTASNADQAAGLASNAGNFYIAITADYNIGSVYPKIIWIKTDTSGIPQHSKMYSAQYMISPKGIALNDDGKTAIVCESNSYGNGAPSFSNLVVLQLDSVGEMDWASCIGTYYDDQAFDIEASGSKWIIAGRSYFLNAAYDGSIIAIDHAGMLQGAYFYDAGTYDGEAFRALTIESDNEFIVAGDAGTFDERNMFLLKADSSGNIQWSETYPISVLFTNYPADVIALVGDSGYAFTGDLRPPTVFRDAALIRTDSMGNAGCLSQSLNINVRTDTVDTLSVIPAELPVTISYSDGGWTDLAIPLLERTICEFPAADYSFTTDTICPEICFTFSDESVNASTWEWHFPGGNPDFSFQQYPPPVCYDSVGTYTVSLTVGDGVNTNSLTRSLSLESFCDSVPDPVFIPNVISPNGDNLNDRFIIKNITGNIDLKIFNRWGQMVFETKTKDFNWPKSGDNISDGVYYYVLLISDKTTINKYHGTIMVLKH